METHIADKFEKMGARAKIKPIPEPRIFGRRRGRGMGVIPGVAPEDAVRLNVLKDKEGTYFDIQAGKNVELTVLDCRARDRHLLLMARDSQGEKSKFLCGHDERDWFVAAIPESSSASNVPTAMEALKPDVVVESQSKAQLKGKEKRKRKNKAYVRQGEWFFIPKPKLDVPADRILKDEPLQRGRGKPHMAEELYRTGGDTVYVNATYPNGLTQKQFEKLNKESKGQLRKTGGFRVMQRDPKAYVRGAIRHSDHKTIVLDCWHEVQMNTETKAKAMRQVYFLD
jgi:hypothetical protein